MRSVSAKWIADVSGSQLAFGAEVASGPNNAIVDSRQAAEGSLFFGIPGENIDGGAYAAAVLEAGAWGVLITPEQASKLDGNVPSGQVVLTNPDPARALAELARAWRRELNATVIGITGSVGKTSTKDLISGLIGDSRSVVATAGNYNTEIGLPLTICGAPEGCDLLVLEMAMRGSGQIAELAEIAEPDIGVITNIGPVHVELLGSLRAIAAAKAELLTGIKPGGTAIIPANEPLLDEFAPADDVKLVRFGDGGDITEAPAGLTLADDVPITARRNLLAAVAACQAAGVEPTGEVRLQLSPLRGQRLKLDREIEIIVDCYNANPLAMTAAIDDLVKQDAGRHIAVLGDMLELGPDARRYHGEIGVHARLAGVDVLVAVGELAQHIASGFGKEMRWCRDAAEAAKLLPSMLEPGDKVLLKASRGVGLEVVATELERLEAQKR